MFTVSCLLLFVFTFDLATHQLGTTSSLKFSVTHHMYSQTHTTPHRAVRLVYDNDRMTLHDPINDSERAM